jgi:hypothetical protein
MAYKILGQFDIGDCGAILPRGWWGNVAWGSVGQYYLGVAGQFGLVDGGAMWLREW